MGTLLWILLVLLIASLLIPLLSRTWSAGSLSIPGIILLILLVLLLINAF